MIAMDGSTFGRAVTAVVVLVAMGLGCCNGTVAASISQSGGSVEVARVQSDTTDGVSPTDRVPLRAVIDDIRRKTGIHFLYRDALIAGVRVQLSRSTDDPLEALSAALSRQGLRLEISADREKAIITQGAEGDHVAHLRGQVVDSETGARLPYATVTWSLDGVRRGQAADSEGTFRLPTDASPPGGDMLILSVSYVGYQRERVAVDPSDPPPELTVRLTPSRTQAPEVLVESYALQSDLDTTWRALTRPDRHAPLGESSVISALQTLPSVGLAPVLSGGLNVRGSRGDGFRVELDGMSIYNQSHLFGLFDAFNAEALTTVGLYYGVAPAEYSAPPGGTLAFQTRTGSQRGGRVGVEGSPTAVSGTLEGPIADGHGSWLVSLRRSTVGVDWFGNESLISQGLGVDRRREALPLRVRSVGARLFEPGAPSASFYDVHAKGVWETDAGHRFTLSTYAGEDDARQAGDRLSLDESISPQERSRRDFIDTTRVATKDEWGNLGASLQWSGSLAGRVVSRVTGAVSRYHSRYTTDDFLYVRPAAAAGSRFIRDRFAHENELQEATLRHRLDVLPPHPGTWTLGYAARLYDVRYEERSPIFASFEGTQRGVQADLYAQYDAMVDVVDLQAGVRGQYFSQGAYVRWSPRLKLRIESSGPLSVGVGYSRNHQFLHRLELVNEVSSAVWIPSTERQPPGSADHLMMGIYGDVGSATSVQVEGYWKHHENLRLHETVSRLQRSDASILLDPWSVRNEMTARGLEVLVGHRVGGVQWTTSYTLSRVDLQPVGNAQSRPAEWDRRHEVMTRIVWSGERASVHATWRGATGVPNPYARFVRREPERLGPYHRLDVGASVEGRMGEGRWTITAGLFNAYARDNPWYRTPEAVWRPDGPDSDSRPEFGFSFLDVYDLGIRPSLTASIRW